MILSLLFGFSSSVDSKIDEIDFWVLWRPHTHFLFPPSFQERVMTALLCLKRVCSLLPEKLRGLVLPTEIRKMILERAFGKERNKW